MKTTELQVQEKSIHCESCEGRIKTVLGRLPGVIRVRASHEAQQVNLTWDDSKTSLDQIKSALNLAGYPVQ